MGAISDVRSKTNNEKWHQTIILNRLKNDGAYYVKIIAASRAGIPDILACYNGRFIAVEVKTPDGKPTELQLHNIEQIANCEGIAFVVYGTQDFAAKWKILKEILDESPTTPSSKIYRTLRDA